MDLPTLMATMTSTQRATLLNLIDRGVANTPRRSRTPSVMKLVNDFREAAYATPTLDRAQARVLTMLATAPRGRVLGGVNRAVLDLLEGNGRIFQYNGKWFITLTAARTLHNGGYLDEEITAAAAEAGQRG